MAVNNISNTNHAAQIVAESSTFKTETKQFSAEVLSKGTKATGFGKNDALDIEKGEGKAQNFSASAMKTMPGDVNYNEIMDVAPKYQGDFRAASAALKSQNNTVACEHFSKAVNDMVKDGIPVDVNALVQAVLRESYMDTTEDLRFYADKVKYFNEAKKMTREYVQGLRDFKTSFSKAAQEAGFVLSDPPAPSDERYVDWLSFQKDFINEHRSDTSLGAATGMNSVVASYKASLAAAESAVCSGPGIESVTKSGNWTTITDKDGYQIKTNVPVGDQVQIYGPNGDPIVEIWGDPHVDEGFNGSRNDWHFGEDSTFILPNGTKVCINTEEATAGSGIYYSKGVDVLSGSGRGTVGHDPVTGADRAASMQSDRATWDQYHADTKGTSGGVFALATGTKEWAKLGDDGKFYDIANFSFDEYKKDHKVKTNSNAVTVSADAIKGATSGANLAKVAENVEFANNYPDTPAGQMAADIGIPTMIPPGDCTSVEELDNLITKFEEKLSTIGDDAQLANTDLQNVLQKQQQTIQMMSNISKMLNDTALAVIRKIG